MEKFASTRKKYKKDKKCYHSEYAHVCAQINVKLKNIEEKCKLEIEQLEYETFTTGTNCSVTPNNTSEKNTYQTLKKRMVKIRAIYKQLI